MAGNRSGKESSGYTLLEVTVALIIIGISLAVLLGQLSRSKALSFKADQMIDSVRILHNISRDSVLIKKAVKEGEVEGNVEGDTGGNVAGDAGGDAEEDVLEKKGWGYSIKADPLEIRLKPQDDPLEIPGMKQIKICIKKDKSSHNRAYCIIRWYHGK